MANLSYQEKSLYGELVVDLAVFVPYFIFMHTRHPTVNFIAGVDYGADRGEHLAAGVDCGGDAEPIER